MTVFLSIGSNVQPQKNIPACLEILKKKFSVKKISSIYETEPVGPAGNRKFWNLAVGLETGLDLKMLAATLRQIEETLGRKHDPADKFAARTIDLDILPQPGYQNQAFIMIPLAEIAGGQRDEETGKTFGEIAEGLTKQGPRTWRREPPPEPPRKSPGSARLKSGRHR